MIYKFSYNNNISVEIERNELATDKFTMYIIGLMLYNIIIIYSLYNFIIYNKICMSYCAIFPPENLDLTIKQLAAEKK